MDGGLAVVICDNDVSAKAYITEHALSEFIKWVDYLIIICDEMRLGLNFSKCANYFSNKFDLDNTSVLEITIFWDLY